MTVLSASTGHRLATEAALSVGVGGGNAVDAAIAAQAIICVTLPQSAGLGGDGLALVGMPDETVAFNGTGLSPADWPDPDMSRVGNHVTVPGLVKSWFAMQERFGSLPIGDLLAPAIQLCRQGIPVDDYLMTAIDSQRDRIVATSPDDPILSLQAGGVWRQPALGDLLEEISRSGPEAFYSGECAQAIQRAVAQHGGALSAADLKAHDTEVTVPLSVPWHGGVVDVQPPSSQGILLGAALAWLDGRQEYLPAESFDHALVELTGAVFEWRDDCSLGAELLDRKVCIEMRRATPRSGPRAYLHTAGVATADRDGTVVSSLLSIFDDFGSAIWVPEVGVRLNNRGGGFTAGRNTARPASRPVHTLAPSLVRSSSGARFALATPGADGQVQTLLQVLANRRRGYSLQEAIDGPRWRSQDGYLVLPEEHPAVGDLADRQHRMQLTESSSELYGAVVCAGIEGDDLFAVADWRRQTHADAS